jgi:CHASE2 domain-containing sensor protein/tRNA A-37 threonylcarbamoyl transferase component Bud32
MWSHGSRRRFAWLLLVVVLAAAVGISSFAGGAFNWLERSTVDARFSLRGRQHAQTSVTIVGIDNASLGALPRYPFARSLHARVIERLHADGARLIVYDISFDRPTTPQADERLLDAAAVGAPIVFSTSLISPSGRTEVLGGDTNLQRIGDRAAAADLAPDGDGVIRHTLDQVNGLPTVARAVAERLGRPVSRTQLRRGWIDFPGSPGTFPSIGFSNVLRGDFDPAAVRGRVVVVGATASVLQDLHSTAAGSPMSGPEVQAAAIGTALAGFPLRSPPRVVTLMLIALLALIVPLAAVRVGTLGIPAVGVAALALWSLAAQLAFNAGVVLDYVYPVLALSLSGGGALVVSIWADRREQMRLRELFAEDAGAMVEEVLRPSGSRGRLEPTAIIAGYRIEEVVGRGGMGVVYRARQLALERPVAIKLVVPELYHDPVLRERFKSESRLAASIEHANVIPVYEAGEDEGLLFIAMRFVDGVDLAQLLERSGPLSPSRTLSLIAQLAGALDAAHARGLVHRDVKPANVLVTLDEPEHLYLTDFGIAVRSGTESEMIDGGWVGTLDFLAPEQIRGDGVDARADIYALAGVLHQCITGLVPFPRTDSSAKLWAHVNAHPPSPSMIDPDLPTSLDDVIAQGMAKEPAARFATAGDLVRALGDAFGIDATAGTSGRTLHGVGEPQSRGRRRSDQPPRASGGPRTMISE